jgi:hypothetical protein
MGNIDNLYSVVLEFIIPGKGGIKLTRLYHTLLPAIDREQALGRAITEAESDDNGWDDRFVLTHHDVAEVTQEMMSHHYRPQLVSNQGKPVVN